MVLGLLSTEPLRQGHLTIEDLIEGFSRGYWSDGHGFSLPQANEKDVKSLLYGGKHLYTGLNY